MCQSPKERVDDERIRDGKIWARIFKLVERRNNERFESKHMTAPERLAIRCAKSRDDQCFEDTVKRWHASLCVAIAMAQHPRQGAGAEAGEPEAGLVRETLMLAGLHEDGPQSFYPAALGHWGIGALGDLSGQRSSSFDRV